MCGIYGILDTAGRLDETKRAWAEQARLRLQHRGPDGHRCLSLMDGQCLLGHLRLAIIDLEGGAQPIGNEDATVWVICNGEIYNYVELRQRLELQGHRFSTRSDTEVLVHLFEEKGTALLDELEGMYAFAVVDTKKRQLFLARDRFGEKPLYWSSFGAGKGIAFASEMKALLALPGLDLSLDVPATAQFLALNYVPAPRTHVNGVRKLQAGEAIVLQSGQELHRFRYWRPQFVAPNGHKPMPREEALETLNGRFRQAVRLRLRSDVAVGAFLSGGIDSTLVASTVREILPDARFTTFCASFDDEQFNEAPYARRVAQQLGSQHHEVRFTSTELLGIFDSLIDHYDEPFADPSMFPTFAVCKAARQHCKVMISGDGGDECFGGYRQFFAYSRWHSVRRFPGVHPAAEFLSRSWNERWRGAGLLNFLSKSDWQLLYSEKQEAATLACFQPAFREQASQGLQELKGEARHHNHLRFPASAMESLSNGYLPEQILVKVDRASMFSALECRTPFLDRELFEFVAHLPFEYHFSGGQGKALLRQSLPSWVPAELRWRQKQGFTPPMAHWLRTDLRGRMQEAIADLAQRLPHLIVAGQVRELNEQHQAERDRSPELFRWLVLSRRTRGLAV